MTSRSPPIPSKNALRALRNLAIGAPALLVGAVGAVGSACGLVAANCEARRQVRLAEKILETKRTIASIANGRSSSRVRRMFEAAERGEDFLLDPSQAHKRRQRRVNPIATTGTKHRQDDVEAVLQAIGGRVVKHHSPGMNSGSEDARAGPGQPNDTQREGTSSTQATKQEESSPPWWSTRSNLPSLHASQQRLRGRRATRMDSTKNTFAAPSIIAFSSGRRSLQIGSDFQSREDDRELAHLKALQTNYARDLRESPAERIRLASMKPMKQGDHSVYGRQPQGTDWRTSPVTGDLVRETLEESELLPLDLAPRANDADAFVHDKPQASQIGPDFALVSGTTLLDNASGADGGQLHRDESPMRPLETIDSTFYAWPGMPHTSSGGNPRSNHETLTSEFDSLAIKGNGFSMQDGPASLAAETDMFGDKIDIFEVFKLAHEIVESESSDSNAVELQVTKQVLDSAAVVEVPGSEAAENERVDRAKWLLKHYGKPQISWLTLLKRAKNADVWIGALEREMVNCASQMGEQATAYKTWKLAHDRKGQIFEEDAMLLAARWALPVESMKNSNLHQPHVLSDASFERTATIDMFLALPPTLGERGQADLADVLLEVGYDLFANHCADIMSHEHHMQRTAGLSSKMRELMAKGSDQDLKLAELLFHAMFKPLQKPSSLMMIPPDAMDLAHSLFTRNLPGRAASILFPFTLKETDQLQDMSRETRTVFLYRSAKTYLERRLYAIQDSAKLREEARQVLQAAVSMGITPSDHPISYLISPTIRVLCARGEEASAARLLEELQTDYSIKFEDTLAARAIIIIGCANRNNMVPLKLMLEELHTHGMSRDNALWFSNLFASVFERLLLQNPLADSYDLLIHAMAYWGLMPHNGVSAALISACLKNERYDFIQEYVQAMRQLYSFLDLGTTGPLCAWRFARAWKEMEATCEDIQKGCQAMAYCATSDPFGKPLRHVAEEAVRLDISRCVATLLTITTGRTPSELFKYLRCLDFDKLIEKAQKSVTEPGPSTTPYLEAREHLLNQIRAVTRLNKGFGGDHMGDQIEMASRHRSALRKRSRSKDRGDIGGFAAEIFQERDILPERETLWKLLAKHYVQRQRQSLPADHDLLQQVLTELLRLQRAVEAASLIRAVYNSPYVSGPSGTYFGEEVLHVWFEIGVRLDSAGTMADALWAFIEAPDVVVATSFVVRVGSVHKKHLEGFVARKRARNPEGFQEIMQYLVDALTIRYRRQLGIESEEDRGLWNEYKSWDERTVQLPMLEDEERTTWGEWMQDPTHSSIGKTVEAVHAF